MKRPVMRYFTLLLIMITFNFLGCSDDDNLPPQWCGTVQPLEDIEWLKEKAAAFNDNPRSNGQQIFAYRYKGEDVFWIDDCVGCADGMVLVYDCDENEVCRFGGIAGFDTCPDFNDEAVEKTRLYSNILD
jgi:hypothetical protein